MHVVRVEQDDMVVSYKLKKKQNRELTSGDCLAEKQPRD